jgi:hypothetical protein
MNRFRRLFADDRGGRQARRTSRASLRKSDDDLLVFVDDTALLVVRAG